MLRHFWGTLEEKMHKYQGAIALEDLFSSSMSKTDVFSKLCKIGPIFSNWSSQEPLSCLEDLQMLLEKDDYGLARMDLI
jgi:hypothetical protein